MAGKLPDKDFRELVDQMGRVRPDHHPPPYMLEEAERTAERLVGRFRRPTGK